MIATIGKMFAYAKAPVKTFAVLHPFKSLKLLGIAALVSAVLGADKRRRRRTPRSSSRSSQRTAPHPSENWTKEELYRRAQELDIEGRSSMTKSELLAAVRAA